MVSEQTPDAEKYPDHYKGTMAEGSGYTFQDSKTKGLVAWEDIKEAKKTGGYVTKDSGVREEYDSGMVRDTATGKARFDLLITPGVPYEHQFLTRVAGLMARGAEKYSDRNWEQANSTKEVDRMVQSGLRHMIQWAAGDRSEDHAAAVVFNLLAAETTKWKLENQ